MSDSKTNYHATVIKTLWLWPVTKLTYEWNGMGTQEAKSILYNNLVFSTEEREDVPRKYFGITSYHLEKKLNFYLMLTPK